MAMIWTKFAEAIANWFSAFFTNFFTNLFAGWFVLALLFGVCLSLSTGCQNLGPKNFDEAMTFIDKIQKIAQEQGVSWKASVISTGSPEVYEKASVGIDTGIRVEVHLQGNAQAGKEVISNEE